MELKKFNKNVKPIENKLARYEDTEGNVLILPISGLICKCEYVKVDEANRVQMEFNRDIPKHMKLNKITVTTQVFKNTITGNKRDKDTIVDQEVEVYELWRVTNGLGMKEIFDNKEEAVAYCNEINNKYMEMI
ncbi:MAG: hypothetical protein V8R01_06635 [Bacilli bacterium]|jgi:hypothetical protein|nr:MAG TPA: ETC complex I subunit conserved region [Caudoviricetes sp.]